MKTETWPYRLLAPGPVPVPPTVLKRMSEKVIHHRTPAFEKILKSAWSGLQSVFQTNQPVMILCGTGSAAMEAAVVNLISPGDEVLVIVSGKFGERWAEMCERYGAKTHRWNLTWGEPARAEDLRTQLRAHPHVNAVFTQACETSTATLHPVQALAQVIREETPQALFAVDAITAAGCLPLPMDAWGIDCMVAGSQKAFMIPTGLSFIALSERAWAAQKTSRTPKYYLDLALERKANQKGETQFSTPTPLIVGLADVLEQIQKVGLAAVMARCELLADVTRTFAPRLGLTVFSKSPSASVTALSVPSGLDSANIRDWLERERNLTIMGGQDQLKGKVLRVGHMGDVRDEDMIALFEALAAALKKEFTFAEELRERLRASPALFPSTNL